MCCHWKEVFSKVTGDKKVIWFVRAVTFPSIARSTEIEQKNNNSNLRLRVREKKRSVIILQRKSKEKRNEKTRGVCEWVSKQIKYRKSNQRVRIFLEYKISLRIVIILFWFKLIGFGCLHLLNPSHFIRIEFKKNKVHLCNFLVLKSFSSAFYAASFEYCFLIYVQTKLNNKPRKISKWIPIKWHKPWLDGGRYEIYTKKWVSFWCVCHHAAWIFLLENKNDNLDPFFLYPTPHQTIILSLLICLCHYLLPLISNTMHFKLCTFIRTWTTRFSMSFIEYTHIFITQEQVRERTRSKLPMQMEK